MQTLVLLLPIFAALAGAMASGIIVDEGGRLEQRLDGSQCSLKVLRPNKMHSKQQPGDAIVLAGAAAIGKSTVGTPPDASERSTYKNIQHKGKTAAVRLWKSEGGAVRPVFDLDSSDYKTDGQDDFPLYLEMVEEVKKKYSDAIIMVCTKQPFAEAMRERGLHFSVVYPGAALKSAYEERVARRIEGAKSEQEKRAQTALKKLLTANWELWQQRWAADEEDLKFELTSEDDYLSNCMDQIVGDIMKPRAQA